MHTLSYTSDTMIDGALASSRATGRFEAHPAEVLRAMGMRR